LFIPNSPEADQCASVVATAWRAELAIGGRYVDRDRGHLAPNEYSQPPLIYFGFYFCRMSVFGYARNAPRRIDLRKGGCMVKLFFIFRSPIRADTLKSLKALTELLKPRCWLMAH